MEKKKLWQKKATSLKDIEVFTIGRDKELDPLLAPFDVLGSIAHIKMLEKAGLLETGDCAKLTKELSKLYRSIQKEGLVIEDGVEDVHSQVELLLTQTLGEAGKKIHSGRSRNDQVLLDLKLYMRHQIFDLVQKVEMLFARLIELSAEHKDILMPGYTHLQVAMPSSFGLWFSAFAESLADDLLVLESAYRVINRNPLGSAAGYGSSFPLDRQMTSDLLGFESMVYNVVYAQMGRGKTERILAHAIANISDTLARLSMDICLYMGQDYQFFSFPDEFTTGSSIMPHKKNPDVFELIRAKSNKIKALPNEITMITTNLPTGYHRDLQVIKESFMPAFSQINDCLSLTVLMLSKIEVRNNLLKQEKYKYLFTVEEVNQLVLSGIPFRDAYRMVGEKVENGTYKPNRNLEHTHAGSIGNLCLEEIQGRMNQSISFFVSEQNKIRQCFEDLLQV
ncbi:MAG: argininosuccinate lyase [Cyclobacteriaceae bacterium]|nr:argininosuccinate lyase [Cyclobacteriaceae bacterium]